MSANLPHNGDVNSANDQSRSVASDVQPATSTHVGSTLDYDASGKPHSRADRIACGEILGDYELLGKLGSGGMGVVFRARQRSADRIVALKVIRPERLQDLSDEKRQEWLDRFRAEAQATARLEHEHIVTVYEVGQLDGVPFYSMRYVDGRSLADIAQNGPLENRRAATMLEPVARAVHHAHTAGILHRDLKPRNILVDSGDRPLVMDFGLVKWLEQETRGVTQTGQVMGTPEYMSPEQTRDSSQVTAASDLYSLGATLYDLVTGRPPFQAASSVETLRQVMDEEPVAPRQLNPAIDRDLETITLKCLAKEPARRYGSAAELAGDLRRFLHGEPILARPVGPIERLRRWARRKPLVAGLSAAVFVLLISVMAILSVAVVRISAASRLAVAAQRQAQEERNAALKARDAAKDERDKFEAFGRFLVDDMLGSVDPNQAQGREITVKEVLDNAAAKIETAFRDKPQLETSLRSAIGATYRALGSYTEAESHLSKAVQVATTELGEEDPETIRAMNNLGMLRISQGQPDEAVRLSRQTLEILLRVRGEEDEETLNVMDNLSAVLRDQGKLSEAEPLMRKALELRCRVLGEDSRDALNSMNELALLLEDQGKMAEAETLSRKGTAASRRVLGEKHPDTLSTMNNLALLLMNLNKLDEAEPLLRQVLETRRFVQGEEHPDALTAMHNLALLLRKQEKLTDCEQLTRLCLEIKRRVLGDDHPETLLSMGLLGGLLLQDNQLDAAEAMHRETFERYRRIAGPDHPTTLLMAVNLAGVLVKQDKHVEAESLYRYALTGYSQIAGPKHPNTLRMQHDLGVLLRNEHNLVEAEQLLQQALAGSRDALGIEHPSTLIYMASLGELLIEKGKTQDAEQLLRECQTIRQKTLPDDWLHFDTKSLLGGALAGQKKFQEAEPLLVEGYSGMKQREANIPPAARPRLSEAIRRLVDLYAAWDRPDEAALWQAKLDEAKP